MIFESQWDVLISNFDNQDNCRFFILDDDMLISEGCDVLRKHFIAFTNDVESDRWLSDVGLVDAHCTYVKYVCERICTHLLEELVELVHTGTVFLT